MDELQQFNERIRAAARGLTAARYVKSLAIAAIGGNDAMKYAEAQNRWADKREVVATLKASVAPLGTSTYPLPTPAAVDFAEYIRPLTIIGRLQGLRRAPSRTRLIATTAGSTAYWAGEAQPRPISSLELSGETVDVMSVVAITVNTRELVLSANPASENILRNDLGKAAVQAMDEAFINPSNAGENQVKPASVLNGVTPRASTGSAVTNVDADLDATINAASDAGSNLEFGVWVMLPRTGAYLGRLRTTNGDLAYPGMSAKGGTLLGFPAITSTGVPGYGSPSAGIIAFLDPSEILVADDDGADFQVTDKATLAMTDESASPPETAQTALWQTESIAFKSTRYVNWRKLRSGMAQYISNVTY